MGKGALNREVQLLGKADSLSPNASPRRRVSLQIPPSMVHKLFRCDLQGRKTRDTHRNSTEQISQRGAECLHVV